MKTVGTKREVYEGLAKRTSGGLRKDNLLKNKRGKVVSKRRHELGLKAFKNNNLKPATKEQLASYRASRSK